MWHHANRFYAWLPQYSVSSMNVAGEGKVCWICRIREIVPDWRPGDEKPLVPNASKFNAKTNRL
jgi:hypothetical protein